MCQAKCMICLENRKYNFWQNRWVNKLRFILNLNLVLDNVVDLSTLAT